MIYRGKCARGLVNRSELRSGRSRPLCRVRMNVCGCLTTFDEVCGTTEWSVLILKSGFQNEQRNNCLTFNEIFLDYNLQISIEV